MHTKISAQLKLHDSNENLDGFFDHVIFCTNVTYADGHFKGGKCVYYYDLELLFNSR